MKHPTVADVALPVPVRKTFAYRIPEDGLGQIRLGCRVNVQFGSRLLTGFVVGLDPQDAPTDLKAIHSVVDSEPLVDDDLLSLTRWIADRSLCSWGEALRAALPGHGATRRERVVSLAAPVTADLFAGAGGERIEDRILAALGTGEVSMPSLARTLGMRTIDLDGTVKRLARAGRLRVTQRIVGAGATGPPRIKVVRLLETVPVAA